MKRLFRVSGNKPTDAGLSNFLDSQCVGISVPFTPCSVIVECTVTDETINIQYQKVVLQSYFNDNHYWTDVVVEHVKDL